MCSARANVRTKWKRVSFIEFLGFSNDSQFTHGCSFSATVQSIRERAQCVVREGQMYCELLKNV